MLYLSTAVVDLRLCTLDPIERVLEFLYGAVQLFKRYPGLPDRFGPIKVLHGNVTESLARVVVHVLLAKEDMSDRSTEISKLSYVRTSVYDVQAR